jgi:hypothetical protein
MECVATEAAPAPAAVVVVEEEVVFHYYQAPSHKNVNAFVDDFHNFSPAADGGIVVTREGSWVAELAVEQSTLGVESEGAWSQFSHVAAETTTAFAARNEKAITTSESSDENRFTRQGSWVAELALEKSTLAVELEGAWSQFSHNVAPVSEATAVVEQPPTPEEEEEEEQQFQVTLKLAPLVPKPDEWIVARTTSSSSCAVAPLPSFDDAEKKRHKVLLARMCATRAKQQAFDVVARLTSSKKAAGAGRVGCECTNETCGSYSRLENEAAELLMLEGAQRSVKAVDVPQWVSKYVGPGQCPWWGCTS